MPYKKHFFEKIMNKLSVTNTLYRLVVLQSGFPATSVSVSVTPLFW